MGFINDKTTITLLNGALLQMSVEEVATQLDLAKRHVDEVLQLSTYQLIEEKK